MIPVLLNEAMMKESTKQLMFEAEQARLARLAGAQQRREKQAFRSVPRPTRLSSRFQWLLDTIRNGGSPVNVKLIAISLCILAALALATAAAISQG